MRNMRIAELLFNRPLMVSEAKLATILHALGPRFNLELPTPTTDMAAISDQERSRAGYKAVGGVGLIGIYGPLMHRLLASDYPSGGPTTYGEIRRAFDLAMVDDSVQSIVLDLDSPGGEVHGAFDLADHIFQSRGQKPITAVINESAYSACYLLASAADRITIPRTGGAGSIGVIATHADFSRAEEAAGITVTHVIAGAKKADFSPHMPLSDPAYEALQGMVNDTYDLFCETVARNRRLSVKDVRATEAGIYEGKKAVAAKLADEVIPADRAVANSRGKGRTMITASSASKNTKGEQRMDLNMLKENHPALYQEVFAAGAASASAQAKGGGCGDCACSGCTEADCTGCDKKKNMSGGAEATATAVAAEQARVCALVTAAFGEEPGKKLAAVAAKGLTSEDVASLGITFAATTTEAKVDETTRTAMLAALHAVAPAGLKGAQPSGGEVEERSAAAKGIAAGANRQ